MSQFINDIKVSVSGAEETQMLAAGYTAVPRNLNKRAGGSQIYLWYKQGTTQPITRIQLSFSTSMSQILSSGGYTKVPKNLNEGTDGDPINLFYYKGNTEYDIPITMLDVSDDPEDEARMFKFGWERLACDLNRNTGGTKMYLWVKRSKPSHICDIDAAPAIAVGVAITENSLNPIKDGYIRVDESTNKNTGAEIFIWYRQSPDKTRAISDLQVSTNDEEYDEFNGKGYSHVKTNLNTGTSGFPIYIWYKKAEADTLKNVTVIDDMNLVQPYKKNNVNVIEKSLNAGTDATKIYLCFYK